jgi:hypothetical protein
MSWLCKKGDEEDFLAITVLVLEEHAKHAK